MSSEGKMLKVIGSFSVIAIVLFLAVLASTSIGAVTGWIVEGWYPSIFEPLRNWTHLTYGYQIGALLGFVGGFFKASLTNSKD